MKNATANQTNRLHRTIKGEPYILTRNEWGWSVVANSSKTDRFYRAYQVYLTEHRIPVRCSCPHHVKRQVVCKHMDEVATIEAEIRQQKAAKTCSLIGASEVWHYTPMDEKSVEVVHLIDGYCHSKEVMEIGYARRHIRWLRKAGFEQR